MSGRKAEVRLWTLVKQLGQRRNSRKYDGSNAASKRESEALPASPRGQCGPRRRSITNLPTASPGADLASAGFQNKPCARTLKESYYRKRKIPAQHEVRGKKSPSSQQLFISCSHPNESPTGKPQSSNPKRAAENWKGRIRASARAQQL